MFDRKSAQEKLTSIIHGKRILFIGPEFHHYHISIRQSLEKCRGQVYYIPTKGIYSATGKEIHDFYKPLFEEVETDTFDFIFVIRGEDIPIHYLKGHKENGSILLSYQWDSLANWNYGSIIPLMDQLWSFDRHDAENNRRINYLPLFFEKANRHCLPKSSRCTVMHVGTFFPWRYQVIERVRNACKATGLSYEMKLIGTPKTLLKYFILLRGLHFDIVSTERINKDKYLELLNRSECIVDIGHPNQSGLTMRTMEALGNGKKLLTTNINIRKEQFYDPDYIFILNEKTNSTQIASFLESRISPNRLPVARYELMNWLSYIFSLSIN